MRYVKTLGLLAAAIAALLAFAGTAWATTLTSPEPNIIYKESVVATSTNSELDGAFVTVKCGHSEAAGNVETYGKLGGQTVNAGGKVTTLTFSGCNYTVHVKSPGTLHINSSKEVFSHGASIEIDTSVGICIFTTNNTKVGTLFDGKNALMGINSAAISRTGGNFLCGSSGTWTGSYDLTKPNDLWID